ncbi:hypothetical protein BCR42DRAFT_400202 [Absidia repens]|uniref:Macro domain-containing protein n=1 Tax=Absidia repens TaxID=90262 RepID=A0A1X2J0X5_9FUNG|nr:hypothetical protein BCR42DRAFT_400202 [Absidia repens]
MGYLPSAFMPGSSNKVTIVMDDITKLQVDAIVNPTNPRLSNVGGPTASAAILKAAGESLVNDLQHRPVLHYGNAITTPSYRLPCNYIIHTAVPSSDGDDEELKACYRNCMLQLVGQRKESIAFPCIGTGVQRFDHERAARIALSAVRDFLVNDSSDQIKHVVFCVFSDRDREIYHRLLPQYIKNRSN